MSNLLDRASILLTPTAVSDSELHSVKPIQTFGSELITNGNFATDTNWTKFSNATISGGTANLPNASAAIRQSGILELNTKYKITYNVVSSDDANALFTNRGGSSLTINLPSSVGSHTVFGETNSSGTNDFFISVKSLAASVVVDSVSLKKVTDGDFDFTRATTATRVGPNGLIQNVAGGLPRIDFLGGTGKILLEPASTNTATYSNDFTQGNIFSGSNAPGLNNSVLTANQGTAPDGTNTAFLLKDNNDGGTGRSDLNYNAAVVVSGNFNTFSIFAKKSLNNDFIVIAAGEFDPGFPTAFFDIQNGTLGNVSSGLTAKIEDYGNGWFRCQATIQTTTDVQGFFKINLSTANGNQDITRDGTNGVLLFGLQAEADASRNFATSYIPTSGSTVTRNKDEANNSGDTSLISSTEGVLYLELAALINTQTDNGFISLNDGTHNNTIAFSLRTDANKIQLVVRSGGVTYAALVHTASFDITSFFKVAVKYKLNDVSMFVNGVETNTDTSNVMPIGLSDLTLAKGGDVEQIFAKVKCVAVFKEALDNDELECLTGSGFDSFTALAEAGSYTII